MTWFDRKFDFQNLNTTFPIILERLSGTPIRMENKLRGLEQELLVKKNGDSWSIMEHAGHLLDLEPLWFGRVEDMRNCQEFLREADLTNQATNQANHNLKKAKYLASEFYSERQMLMDLLVQLSDHSHNFTARHPRLGIPMRLIDHAYFVAEHDDHHLATMNHLARQFASS